MASDISPISSEFRTEGDYAIVRKLLQNPRYEIPERLRRKVVGEIERTVDDEEADPNLKMRAISVLAQLDKHNIELVKLSMPKRIERVDPKKMDDEKLLEAVQEVLKLAPRILEPKTP